MKFTVFNVGLAPELPLSLLLKAPHSRTACLAPLVKVMFSREDLIKALAPTLTKLAGKVISVMPAGRYLNAVSLISVTPSFIVSVLRVEGREALLGYFQNAPLGIESAPVFAPVIARLRRVSLLLTANAKVLLSVAVEAEEAHLAGTVTSTNLAVLFKKEALAAV
ncbi:hypothetical protein Barb7_02708 [Bacteroidales bacterium Barb7]|nr:hypothetical protein Barb7_02708 [Bacteroidales bacterium Barb7]